MSICMRALTIMALLPAATAPATQIAERTATLTRATRWSRSAAIPIRFRTFHPQGMVKIGDAFFVSAVEVRKLPEKLAVPEDGHTYGTGQGIGHLFKIASNGTLLADLRLGEGSIYHPGGIDFDGSAIWVPVAEYRPRSRSIIYRVDPVTMRAAIATRVADHVGGVVHDRERHRLIGMTWGSRTFLTWPIAEDGTISADAPATTPNPESYIDYQDCHVVGERHMICAGIAEYQMSPTSPPFPLGGIDVVDLATLRPTWQTPVALWSLKGRAMTQNPFWLEATATGLRAWFLPDDDVSTLYAYDAETAAR